MTFDSALFCAELRVDPLSRCAALMLPQASAAVLPFYQTQAELEIMEQDQSQLRSVVPYRNLSHLTPSPAMYPILLVSSWTLEQRWTAGFSMSSSLHFYPVSTTLRWRSFSSPLKQTLGKPG
jgi:hypothetical protein